MKIHIAVVAHTQRREQATKLADSIGADHVTWDTGVLGCTNNHRAAWQWHMNHPSDWAVTLEDDAVPCKEFRHQLSQALTVAPATVVGLYLGKLCPPNWQDTVEKIGRASCRERV